MPEPMTPPDADPKGRTRFLGISVAITLLAFLLRMLYLWTAQVDIPIRGDSFGYWTYASNLLAHGTFSSSPPDGATIVPDSFRGPGYPLFLAMCAKLGGVPGRALATTQAVQILIGSALVPLTIALARSWLPRPAALLAGLLVALWPHLIVFSSTFLSETLFAFMLLLMAVTMVAAQRRGSHILGVSSGLVGGLAYLVNPVVLLFPPVIAGLLATRRQARLGLSLLLGFTLVAGAWSIRNSGLPDSASAGHRASMNLVEGSWPLFLDAHNDQAINEVARAIADAVREEEELMSRDPQAGFQSMWGRFQEDPRYYLRWYLLDKPYLLWEWRIRIGWGDIYFAETRDSPFDRNSTLRAMHGFFRWSNPYLFALASLGALICLVRMVRRTEQPFPLVVVALFFVYITAIHTVFQAEPRYSVAYRPFEILLAVSIIAVAIARLAAFARRREVPASRPTAST